VNRDPSLSLSLSLSLSRSLCLSVSFSLILPLPSPARLLAVSPSQYREPLGRHIGFGNRRITESQRESRPPLPCDWPPTVTEEDRRQGDSRGRLRIGGGGGREAHGEFSLIRHARAAAVLSSGQSRRRARGSLLAQTLPVGSSHRFRPPVLRPHSSYGSEDPGMRARRSARRRRSSTGVGSIARVSEAVSSSSSSSSPSSSSGCARALVGGWEGVRALCGGGGAEERRRGLGSAGRRRTRGIPGIPPRAAADSGDRGSALALRGESRE
jgi:hypothetical protein